MAINAPQLKVAIVHDWLVGGGAELVVEQLHRMYPDAPIYTSYATAEWRQRLDGQVRTGYLQHFGRWRKLLPVARIWWFSRLRLRGYDLVISSSGAEAKGIRVPAGTMHINYCHAPTHYYWSRYDQYLRQPGFGALDSVARLGLRLLVGPLRRWDLRAAQRPDVMIANSSFIQAEIKKYYARDSVVVHPPVNVEAFHPASDQPRHGFVCGGRLTPYKRNDLAVQACTALGLPLTVFGDGPDRARLESLAGPTVQFTGKISADALVALFGGAAGFIFGVIDDFGIVSVEALAAGTPVIALHGGGALDYVVPGQTGQFFEEQTVASLQAALQEFKPQNYKPRAIMKASQHYSNDNFMRRMTQIIEKTCAQR